MKSYLLILLYFLLSFGAIAQESRVKYHKAKIYYSNIDELTLLSQLGLETDHGLNKKDVFIQSDFSERELEIAQEAGYTTEIIIDDVQKFYEERSKSRTPQTRNTSCVANVQYPMPENFELGSMAGFFTYDEILAELDQMASLYPNLITAKSEISSFQTTEGRPLYWLKMSDNPNVDEAEPEMLYDAVHHAREPASVSTLIYYMWYLLENYATNDEVAAILDNTELYFVPVVNPDGYVYNVTNYPSGGGMWRKNRRNHGNGDYGVDNNRNYSVAWGTTGISFDTESNVYPGSEAFSEAENQAMKWFCENHEFKLALNNHSYSNLLLYPYGYEVGMPTADDNLYQVISEEMVSQNGFVNQLSAELYPASGDSDDWMYDATPEKAKILSFTPEIGNESDGFWPSQDRILELCNDVMYMNLTAAHIITKYGVVDDLSAQTIPSLSTNIPFNFVRMGLQDANYTVSLEPISSNISSVGSNVVFSGVALFVENSGSISLNLNSSIEAGDVVQFNIVLDNGDYQSSTMITKTYGQEATLFEDDMSSFSEWSNNGWSTTSESYTSAPSSITDSPFSNYDNNTLSSIELSNEIDLSDLIDASFHFQTKWAIETGWDYVQVEVSTDNGNSWTAQCGEHTTEGNANQVDGEPLYDGFQAEWIEETISLSQYIGESIKIRFVLHSDGFVTEDGFYIDDLSVNFISNSPVGIVSSSLENLSTSISPNPASSTAIITYDKPNNLKDLKLIIYNNIGQEVDVITLNKLSNNYKIDLSKYEQGMYYYSIIADGIEIATEKMIIRK